MSLYFHIYINMYPVQCGGRGCIHRWKVNGTQKQYSSLVIVCVLKDQQHPCCWA